MNSMKYLIVIGILIVLTGKVIGKDELHGFYPASTISEAMKKDAWAVCRDYQHEFELTALGKATEKVHIVITILNEKGDAYGKMMLPYDKSKKVKSITGRFYNELGLPLDKLKDAAIQDVNYTSAGTLYDDFRIKLANFKINSYPYTVEYNYEIEYDGMIGYPNWQPIEMYRISCEKSSFLVSYPDKLDMRIRELNMPQGSMTAIYENGRHIKTWRLDSVAAWREEPYSPELTTQTAQVILGPANFTYDGLIGSMTSWENFGKWVAGLNNGRDQLPLERQTAVRALIGEGKDTIQVINTLYQYMQKRTRYVGIQLGLGGFQPFPAETVDRLGYGDCKALSNYMKALLNCVGIPSFYVLAGAGSNQGITMMDFPTASQNNHAILCVPFKKDTIWLECTSQTSPFGYLGRFVEGRKVLLITPEGGKLTTTPLLKSEENLQLRDARVEIKVDGTMQANVKTQYTGYQYDNVSPLFEMSKEDQEKELLEDISIPGAVLGSFTYEVKKVKIPQAVETMTLSSSKYTTKTGTRLFIPMNMLNQRKSAPDKVDSRKMPVVQEYSYHDKDSIVFQLPQGYQVETIPKSKIMSTEYGEYRSSVAVENGMAVYVRDLKVKRGTWPKENYPALIDFYTGVVNADKAKLVLKEQIQ
jgi:hypothetical protein